MKIFNYDRMTREYTGFEEAREDPEETRIQGKPIYLIPAHATTIPIPKEQTGYAIIFNQNNEWELVEDLRGKLYYSKTTGVPFLVNDLNQDLTDYTNLPIPGYYYIWNENLKSWIFNKESWLNDFIRPKRNSLLDECDIKYCNADKWELMSNDEKILWRNYKQKLRSFTSIVDPDNLVWPTNPLDNK